MLNVFLLSPPVPTMEAAQLFDSDAAHQEDGDESGDLALAHFAARYAEHDFAGFGPVETVVLEKAVEYLFHDGVSV